MSQASKLAELGIDSEHLTDEQRTVLNSLSAEEINVLASVKQRLETVGGDVQGHSLGGDDDPGVWGGIAIF